MFGSLSSDTLQAIWWVLCSTVGALFLFMNFVQGGQTLIFQVAKTEEDKTLVINSLGRKWELSFTTLVVFGGALFAAFPKFYATSFGGAYWVWMLILFCFVIQAVSYEYRKKPRNIFGAKTYELFLFINGSLGVLLFGAALGTFFTGSDFSLNDYQQVLWGSPLRGLEAALAPRAGTTFNLCFGLFLALNARTLGAMYLLNNLQFADHPQLEGRLRRQAWLNFAASLPFLLYLLGALSIMDGFAVSPSGQVSRVAGKYLDNLLNMPWLLGMLLFGLGLCGLGAWRAATSESDKSIWLSGPGTVLLGLSLLCTAALNRTAFYPSYTDLQSSLTLQNASSSHYTLTVLSYVALLIPFVIGYIAYVWRKMDLRKLSVEDLKGHPY